MEMDQDIAQKLFFEGAVCFCLNFPVNSEFGIDNKSYVTEGKFCGLKMIPPGLHFIHYSIHNSHGDQSPRRGFLYNFKTREVVVKKWDSVEEELIDEDNVENIERLKQNLKLMDKYLGPYPYEILGRWKNLSNYISQPLLDKMIPLCGRIHSVLEMRGTIDNTQQNISRRPTTKLFVGDEKDNEILPKLIPAEGMSLRFSKIPDRCYPENSTPSQITKHSLDSSYVFHQILSQHTNFQDIHGEIQLAFICFLIGCSFEAFEHWKKLVGILCSCDEAISENSEIFSGFITVLIYQLQEIQEDFLVDIVEGNNFIFRNLRIFFRNLYSSNTNGRLKTKGKRFQEFLTKKFQWDFSDILEEEEEDLPVVVEL